MFTVIREFYDLEDFTETKDGKIYRHYNKGETYPRAGFEPSEERIALLASDANLQGTPIIQELTAVAEEVTEAPADETEAAEEAAEAAPEEEKPKAKKSKAKK